VNLSVLLNILDGVLEQPGRILIMTSNHPEKLDKALLRPGRIDVLVHFDYCKKHEIREIVEAFVDTKVSRDIEASFVEGQYTPAEVTQIIFECIEDLHKMIVKLSTPKPKVIQTFGCLEPMNISIPDTICETDSNLKSVGENNVQQLVEDSDSIVFDNGNHWMESHEIYHKRYKLKPILSEFIDDFQSCGVLACDSNTFDNVQYLSSL
jgi:SpoVK/Ycf46/Vps4 family AAA+-type ATPase